MIAVRLHRHDLGGRLRIVFRSMADIRILNIRSSFAKAEI